MYMNSSIQQRTKQLDQENSFSQEMNLHETKDLRNTGKISSLLIAQILKKDAEQPSMLKHHLFPYVCMRCRKESVFCSSSVQTEDDDLIQQTTSIEKYKQTEKNEFSTNFIKNFSETDHKNNKSNILSELTTKKNELSKNIIII